MKENSRNFSPNCPNSEPSTMGQDRANDQRKPTPKTRIRFLWWKTTKDMWLWLLILLWCWGRNVLSRMQGVDEEILDNLDWSYTVLWRLLQSTLFVDDMLAYMCSQLRKKRWLHNWNFAEMLMSLRVVLIKWICF